RIAEHIRPSRDLEERLPVRVRVRHHREVAVLGLEGAPPPGEDALVPRALQGRDEGLAVQMLHHHVGDHALHHGDLDGLALARALAVEERGEHRRQHGEGARLVGDDGRHVAGLAHDGSLERGEAGGGLDHVVVRGFFPVGPGRPEALGRAVDEPRIDGMEGRVVEAEPGGRRGAEIVEHGVRGGGELEEGRPAARLLEIEHDAPLVAVAGEKEGAHPRVPRGTEPARGVALRRLDFDDVGAEVTQGLGRPWPEHDRGHVDDPHAVERSGHEAPRLDEAGPACPPETHRVAGPSPTRAAPVSSARPTVAGGRVDRSSGCDENSPGSGFPPHGGVPLPGGNMESKAESRTLLKLGAVGAATLGTRIDFAAAQEKPKRGGTLTIGRNHDADTLYPGRSTGLSAIATNLLIYDGLVLHDFQMKIRPALAERWEVSPDGLTWTFYLKKGVKFHCGAPLTAQDVKDHFDRWIDPKENFPTRAKVTALAETRVVDDSTIVCRLKNPTLVFLNNISQTE